MHGRERVGRGRLRRLLASSSVAALLIGGGAPAAFAQCAKSPGTNQSSVSNSTAINCININGITVTGNVTNTGTGVITATGLAAPTRTGITVNNASVGGAIVNAGHITASTSGVGIFVTNGAIVSGGILNSGSIAVGNANDITLSGISAFAGGITNSGTLSANYTGIFVSVSTFSGGITNSGSIAANGSGGGIRLSGPSTFVGGITNSGTINATNGDGIDLLSVGSFGVASAGGGISNSGTITASGDGISLSNVTSFYGGIVNAGTGTISGHRAIDINSGSLFAGGINNSGTLMGVGSTALRVFAISTFQGGIANSGMISGTAGILVNDGSTFAGGITNSGTISASNANGIFISFVSNFSGGIGNSGTISAVNQNAIFVGGKATGSETLTISNFSGGISNSGTITAGRNGIWVGGTATCSGALTIATFSGGISNAGTISAAGNGIWVGGNAATNSAHITISNFAGGISNSGMISAAGNGIFVGGSGYGTVTISTFSGGISNFGTISAGRNGIWVGGSATGTAHLTISTFSGGISNSGMISAAGNGIFVGGSGNGTVTISTFSGGISNSGTIIAGNSGIGIWVLNVATFTGGITNSGTISVASSGAGIALGVTTFYGNVANSGTIIGARTGIYICGCVTFANGGIINTGIISATTGIVVENSAPVGIFDSGTIIGTGGTAIDLSQASGGNTLTLGPGFFIQGNVLGHGTDTFQLGGSGSGAFDLSWVGTQYTGFTTFNVVSGVWTVSNIDAQPQAWNVNGGTLAGTGTLPGVNVNNGGTLEPGTIGQPGTFMTINGNLAFQSGAIYLINIDGTTASRANVSGAVTLNGALDVILQSGSYSGKTVYDILDPTSISGRFSSSSVVNAPGLSPNITYTSTGVFVNLTANIGGGGGLDTNQQNVAGGINNYFNNGGTLPASLFPLFTAAGSNLGNTLSQLSGEAATGAEQSALQLTNEFLNLMLDPFVNGRGYAPGATGGSRGALGFAPDEQTNLPSDVALAYAAILGKAPPQSFDQRWSAWGAAYGGSSTTNGDSTVGSHDITAGTYGFAAGMDYHVSPTSVVGFALAGAGTNWGLSNGLGGGYSDALQIGTYGITWFGPAYLAGALSFSNHWFTTNRSALGDQLTASFAGQSYGARFEGGYRVPVWRTFGVTPYGALQAQDFQTPSYSESDTTGGGFGLSYNAMNATDVRTELGARFDDPTLLYGRPLILFGRLAWAHDFVSNPALSAAFESLPGSTFTVNGAPIPQNSVLTTAGAQYFLASNWSLIAKFDGEFANGSHTYGGSGTLRYTW